MKKLILMALALSLVITLSLVGTASAAPQGSQKNLVSNGDFETGDLTGWTVFQTTGGVTNEVVELFDTTGSGDSYAANFNVGETSFTNTGEGGGIYQEIIAPAGTWEISTSIASSTLAYTNFSGGLFELMIDGSLVASHDFGDMDAFAIERATLSATGSFTTSGIHEVRIKMTRPYLTQVPNTPTQYVDNVNLRMTRELVGKVTGGGTVEWRGGLVSYGFSAKQTGEYPCAARGELVVKAHDNDGRLKGDIVYLAVDGSTAWMGGIITQSNIDCIDVGEEFIFEVRDNGEGNAPAPDQVSAIWVGCYSASDACEMPLVNLEFLTNGNVQVH